jgi:hypothetical protein
MLFRQSSAVAQEGPAKSSDVSPQEISRLRPALVPDIKEVLARVYNIPNATQADIAGELKRCKFAPLKLGELGRAILAEDDGPGGKNAVMLNIYVPAHGSYRRVVKEVGFGPTALKGRAVPDLVFGTSGGVCTATLVRYRYANGTYAADACDQEYQGDAGAGDAEAGAPDDCAIKRCNGPKPLPTFPSPFAHPELAEDVASGDQNACSAVNQVAPESASASSSASPPANAVRFGTNGSSSGNCSEAYDSRGKWITSDPRDVGIDNTGLATCIHPTLKPAEIGYTGIHWGQKYKPATLDCK